MSHVFSPTDCLDSLGSRARVRRMGLPMRSVYLADMLGVPRATLQQWEHRLPSTLEPQLQASWERLLDVPPGWLVDLSMVASDEPAPELVRLSEKQHPTLADTIRGVGRVLLREQARHNGLSQVDYAEYVQRNVELFATRYGVHGEEQAFFRAAGAFHGISMQRAQQVMNKMLVQSARYRFSLPALDRLEARLAGLLPAPVAVVDARLGRLLGDKLSILGLQRFSVEILRRSLVSIESAA